MSGPGGPGGEGPSSGGWVSEGESGVIGGEFPGDNAGGWSGRGDEGLSEGESGVVGGTWGTSDASLGVALPLSSTLSNLFSKMGYDKLGKTTSTEGLVGKAALALGTLPAGSLPGMIAGLVSEGQQGVPGGYAPPSSGLSAGQGDPGLPGDFGFGDAASGPADMFPGRPMPEVIPPRAPSEDTRRDRILQAAAPSYTGPPQPAVETGATVKMADILDTWDRTTPSPTDIDALQAIRERLGGAAATAAPVTPPAPITPSAFFTPRTAAARLVEPPRPRLRLPRV